MRSKKIINKYSTPGLRNREVLNVKKKFMRIPRYTNQYPSRF